MIQCRNIHSKSGSNIFLLSENDTPQHIIAHKMLHEGDIVQTSTSFFVFASELNNKGIFNYENSEVRYSFLIEANFVIKKIMVNYVPLVAKVMRICGLGDLKNLSILEAEQMDIRMNQIDNKCGILSAIEAFLNYSTENEAWLEGEVNLNQKLIIVASKSQRLLLNFKSNGAEHFVLPQEYLHMESASIEIRNNMKGENGMTKIISEKSVNIYANLEFITLIVRPQSSTPNEEKNIK